MSQNRFCLSRARGIFEGWVRPLSRIPAALPCWIMGRHRGNAPGLGDLVISEVLANPVGADAGRDWLELRTLEIPILTSMGFG